MTSWTCWAALRGRGVTRRRIRPALGGGRARPNFQIPRPQGSAKCIAANGRLEIRLPRDFSAIDRRKLGAAVAALLDQIG